MSIPQNFPFAAIMLTLIGGVVSPVLKPKAAKWLCLVLNAFITLIMACTLANVLLSGNAYVYKMGHFPAPWGNELKIGAFEAGLAMLFSLVMLLSLLGGMSHIMEDCEEKKSNHYFSIINLLMSSIYVLIFTNDIFTAYVFVEINTIAACALVMLRYKTGKTIVATTQYLIMSLLGSGAFLIGIGLLYDLTGHLLMPNIAQALQPLFQSGEYMLPLAVILSLFAVGMGIKSAIWPFHSWLPDAHGSATTTSSAVLSGLVLKVYVILLIKIFYRVIGLEWIRSTYVTNILFVLGIAAMVFGSIHALRERDLKRMLAYSSVAQIGYIYLGIGLGTQAGMVAACINIVVHAVTKPMLFCAAGGFMEVSGGSRKMADLRGAARRDPLAGVAFAVGAFSMIGVPLFSGFITKIYLGGAAADAVYSGMNIGVVAIAVVVISTMLNASYYLPALINLFSAPTSVPAEGKEVPKPRWSWEYIAAIAAFIVLNIFFGLASDKLMVLIERGLGMFG